MRKNLSVILIATSIIFSASASLWAAQPGKHTQDAVSAINKKYSGEKGVESLNLGRVGLTAFRAILRLSSDKDSRAMLELTRNIEGMSMMEYEDCSASVRAKINAEVEAVLAGVDMLMEIRDDDDTVRIYGTLSQDGKTVSDTIIFIPDDEVLICFYGSVDIAALQNSVDL